MSQDSRVAVLEARIARYYERYQVKKIAFAVLVFGIFTFGASFSIYVLSQNFFFAALGFALTGLVSINLAMLFVVPPAQKLEQSRALICGALHNRSRIKVFDVKAVKLADKEGNAVALKGVDLRVWRNFVVPFLVTHSSISAEQEEQPDAAEQDDTHQRELEAFKQKIRAELKALEAKRESIKARVAELAEAEEHAKKMRFKDSEDAGREALKLRPAKSTEDDEKASELEATRQKIKAERKELEAEAVEVARSTKSLAGRLDELSEDEASESGRLSS